MSARTKLSTKHLSNSVGTVGADLSLCILSVFFFSLCSVDKYLYGYICGIWKDIGQTSEFSQKKKWKMLYSGMLFKTVCMPKISYGFATCVVKKRKYVRWISADM